jgi:hypothetical protein
VYDALARLLTVTKRDAFRELLPVRFYMILSEVLTKVSIDPSKKKEKEEETTLHQKNHHRDNGQYELTHRTYLVGGSYALSAFTSTKPLSRNVDIFLPFMDTKEVQQFEWSLLEFKCPTIGPRTEYSRNDKNGQGTHHFFDSSVLLVSTYTTEDGIEIRFFCVKVDNVDQCVVDQEFASHLNRLCDFFTRVFFRLGRMKLEFEYIYPEKDVRYIQNKQVPRDETKISTDRLRKYVDRGWVQDS